MSTSPHFYYGAAGQTPGVCWQIGRSWVFLRYDTDVPEIVTNPATLAVTTEVEPSLRGYITLAYEMAIQEDCAPVRRDTKAWKARASSEEGHHGQANKTH